MKCNIKIPGLQICTQNIGHTINVGLRITNISYPYIYEHEILAVVNDFLLINSFLMMDI